MSTTISKKDTLDLADGIAEIIQGVLERDPDKREGFWIKNIIKECLDDWISDCETEKAENKNII